MSFLKRQFETVFNRLQEIDPMWVQNNFCCPVCFELPTQYKILDCGHILCIECFSKLLEMEKRSCPSCRSFISTTDFEETPEELVDFKHAFFEQIGVILKKRLEYHEQELIREQLNHLNVLGNQNDIEQMGQMEQIEQIEQMEQMEQNIIQNLMKQLCLEIRQSKQSRQTNQTSQTNQTNQNSQTSEDSI